MFQRPPLKTYERKKGAYRHPFTMANTITRQELPPDRKRQPPDSTNDEDEEASLEYDPFDTVFDQLAKDTIVPPVPQDQISMSSYSDSSSDCSLKDHRSTNEDSTTEDPFSILEPVEEPKQKIKRRNNKKQKVDDRRTIVTTRNLSRDVKRRRRPRPTNSTQNENIEPNTKPDMKNRRGERKSVRKKAVRKKPSDVEEKTEFLSFEENKRKPLDYSRAIKQCSISLKRISLPYDASLNSENAETNEIKKIRSDSSNAGESSEINESRKPRNDALQSVKMPIIPEEEKDTFLAEKNGKKAMESSKNLVVSLPRLRVSKRLSGHHFSSSTPIGSRVSKQKSSLRLSPIKNDGEDEFDESHDLGMSSLLPKPMIKTIDAVSMNATNSSPQKLKEQEMKKSIKRSKIILSTTPDSEPSCLMFEDTQPLSEKSNPKNGEYSTDTNVASADSSTDFGRESSDHESLHLTYDENEELPSKDLSDCVETMEFSPRIPSIADNENYSETMKSSTTDPFMGFSGPRIDIFNEKNSCQKSCNNDDEWSTVSGSLNETSNASIQSTNISDGRETIEQLSSGENSSSGSINEFVSASEKSSVYLDSCDAISEADITESSKMGVVESTAELENTKEKFGVEDEIHALQPVVLLSRLPNDQMASIKNETDTRNTQLSDTLNSVSRLTTDDETASTNELSLSLEKISDAEESHIEMESLKVDDYSDDMTEMEKSLIPRTPEEDLNNHTEESSTEHSSDSSDAPSLNFERENVKEISRDYEISLQSKENEDNALELFGDNSSNRNVQNSNQPVVLLTRLNDHSRITRRRNKYLNWDLKLGAISEINVEQISPVVEETGETKVENVSNTLSVENITKRTLKESKMEMKEEIISRVSSQVRFSQKTDDSRGTSLEPDENSESTKEDKVVYLKPGKSWARSLSILSQVHSQEDVESLAVGKGKKWRQSVKNLLGMQQQGLVQSCIKKNDDDKELPVFGGLRTSSAWNPGSSQPESNRLFGISSPGRFTHRLSIRVVPDCKSFDHIKDTSFLEAYGLTKNERKHTIAPRRTFITPRRTFDFIPKSLNSIKSRDVVLTQCGQNTSLPFDECYPESYLEHCRKIGEGVYGEVFLYEKESEKNVIKIIPIEGEMKINNERQKKFDEILSEIVIAKELHNLRFADKSNTSGFVEVKNIRCVMGRYPKKLVELWQIFDEEKNSENDCPLIFQENQLYIVLELGHGGEDLEAYVFQNASETHALFMQTALALAVAEESLEFEHRDLHWGNLLISRTDESQINFKLNDKPIRVTSKGVKVSVIDFTLSRMSYQGCSIFNDLSMDDDLFVAQGEYQFEIYRRMRTKLENNWQKFEPFTNILWLHYILDKMITAVRYRRKNTKIHTKGIAKLQELKDEILQYKSAIDFVTNSEKATRLQESRTSVSTVSSST